MEPIINMQSGLDIDLVNPTPEMIKLEDIAKGLAYKGHFAGHTPKYFSIAEHSILVAEITEDVEGLLHDAAEAYIGDMVRPIKQLFPSFKEMEINLLVAIEESLGLDPGFFESNFIKHADNAILAIEWDEFFPKKKFNPFLQSENDYNIYEKYKNELKIQYLSPEESYTTFINKYKYWKAIE